MNRYITTPKQITAEDAPAYYAPSIPASIPNETVPFYYQSRQGDRLDTISNLFYKTPSNWWVIAKANNLADGTITIPEGTVLRIPNV